MKIHFTNFLEQFFTNNNIRLISLSGFLAITSLFSIVELLSGVCWKFFDETYKLWQKSFTLAVEHSDLEKIDFDRKL